MSDDRYFKDKAKEICNCLNLMLSDEEYIYIRLKEVARDQRYACIENVMNHFKDDYDNIDLVCNTIHNSNIEVKQ